MIKTEVLMYRPTWIRTGIKSNALIITLFFVLILKALHGVGYPPLFITWQSYMYIWVQFIKKPNKLKQI